MGNPSRVRVLVSDTNTRGSVDDTRLLVFFEAARADALRERGLPYDMIISRGLNALTLEARLRNHADAHADDLLLVHVWVSDIGRVRFTFAYEVRRDSDNTLVASGETVHICVDGARGRPEGVPDWLRACLTELRGVQEPSSTTNHA